MSQPQPAVPEGVTVDAVDWLPSGTASGLIRVRGHAAAPLAGLPDLVIEHGNRLHRFTSLPDPRANLEPHAWRGAYVVNADLVAAAGHRMVLEWPGGAQLALPAVNAPAPPVAAAPAPVEEQPGGEVVDRAVLAERRARRAEAAEQAQARIAREALRAVEVLELRANELEDKLHAAGEPAVADVSGWQERLSRAQAREAELAARIAELEAQVRERPAPEYAADGDRRADRLREALATTIVTVGQLRLQLHEAQLARRTRDVAWGADAVRRTVAERERAELAAALSAARAELHDVRHADTRASTAQADLAAREADLNAARERIAQLEAEVVEARHAADRTAAAAAERAEAVAREAAERAAAAAREAGDRAAAVVEEATRRAEAAEAALAEVAERVEAAEARVRAAEVAREVAEAVAVAAASERRAAEVAHAARISSLEAELAAARTARAPAPATPAPASTAPEPAPAPAPAPKPEPPAPRRPPVPPDLAEQAAEQAAAARRAARAADRDRIKADLEAAAQVLRETPDEPVRPTIVPARSELPRRIASGDSRRLYPPLRGALVRLAHDDARAAAEIIAGLVPAQWRVLNTSVEYTLAIRELPEELHIVVNPGGAGVGGEPRGPRVAASAHDLAQALAGHPPRIGRFGRIRVSGPRAVRRRLLALLEADLTLEEVIRGGATIDPVLALRFLAYSVPTAWTRGHRFTVAQTITGERADRTVYLTAADARGLTCSMDPPASPPDAHVTLSETAFRTLMLGGVPEPGERPATRGDHRAAEQLRAWADRVRRSDF